MRGSGVIPVAGDLNTVRPAGVADVGRVAVDTTTGDLYMGEDGAWVPIEDDLLVDQGVFIADDFTFLTYQD
jgi:hypothetical protein